MQTSVLSIEPVPVKPGTMSLLAFICLVFPLAVMVSRPESGDFYAAAGAFIAAFIAWVEAVQKKRPLNHRVSTICGALVSGVFGPSVTHNFALKWHWIDAGDAFFLTWSVWACAGFFLASNGFFIIHGINKLIQTQGTKWFGVQEEPGVTSDSASTSTQQIESKPPPGPGRARM